MVSKETLEEIKYYSEHPWNEKTAKDMFEDLEFTLIKCNEQVLEYENPYDETIYFDKIGKYYSAYCRNNAHDFDIYTDDAMIINIKLHKAINKQVEELRW